MEEIISKLQNVGILMSLLDDEDKIKYENEALKKLTMINTVIDDLQSDLMSLKLSKEKCDELELQNKKEHIISKSLFPYYWALNECMANIKNDDEGKLAIKNLETNISEQTN
ncbi:putative ORFan [Tupanvirus deep ocean]|uniref:ORFan n=2 Tax=Tupanvirus TaxID=2094720 RepID=A0AC62A957_9VIRU|nr:putative ORFan [Tupanvirus deep ocean]QKU34269.1 putative ORFan [Tupanvirus deep ocean]